GSQCGQRDATGHQRQGGTQPSQVGAFIGQGEPRIGILADPVDRAGPPVGGGGLLGAHWAATRSSTTEPVPGLLPSGASVLASSRAAGTRSLRCGGSGCRVSRVSRLRSTAPGLACNFTPAPSCSSSSRRARPAPRRHAASPTAYTTG